VAPVGKKPALVLIGFMGAGKSRAVRAARDAGLDGVDADLVLQEELGMPIADFFETHGEEEFRRLEEEASLRLLGEGHEAVALGGGGVLSDRVREALGAHTVAWLRVPLDVLWERAEGSERPLARDRVSFERLYRERERFYRRLADAVLLSADALPRALGALQGLRGADPARLLWAQSASGEYPVWVGRGVGRRAPWPASGRRFCVSDTVVAGLYRDAVEPLAALVEVAPGEQAKTLGEAERVLRELAAAGMTRSDHVVALGGGVVGDLAGFCAATYQRGVPVVQVPTTLVAQVDSAYGGKTGVDLPEGKNYIGAYHLPAGVIADTAALHSLPSAELAAGYPEVLKTALIAGGELWDRVRSVDELEPGQLEDLVFDCAVVKAEVVAADERDSGHREVLNLGHTVGHAIEAASGYRRYRHGEAVGLGLLAALRLSGADELRGEVQALLGRRRLPVDLDHSIAADDVLAAIERDKKRTPEGVGFVLLSQPGEPRTGQRVDRASLRAAVEELR
jgi:shikimate kinase / 3-dehydroquinate synthase